MSGFLLLVRHGESSRWFSYDRPSCWKVVQTCCHGNSLGCLDGWFTALLLRVVKLCLKWTFVPWYRVQVESSRWFSYDRPS